MAGNLWDPLVELQHGNIWQDLLLEGKQQGSGGHIAGLLYVLSYT